MYYFGTHMKTSHSLEKYRNCGLKNITSSFNNINKNQPYVNFKVNKYPIL